MKAIFFDSNDYYKAVYNASGFDIRILAIDGNAKSIEFEGNADYFTTLKCIIK